MKRALCAVVLVALTAVPPPAGAAEFGVYVQAVENVPGAFEEVVGKAGKALAEGGWQVIASYGATVPEGCGFRAHTMVLHHAGYGGKILAHGPRAAFAIPLRVMVWQDEMGTHVGYLNPSSINRTVLGDGTADEISAETSKELSRILSSAVGGTPVNRQIGQVRDGGRVGGMGGGDFAKKVEIIHEAAASDSSLGEIAARVEEGFESSTGGWTLAYRLDCVPQGAVILGVNKPATEARAYGIAGEKRESRKNSCPGIDHAAAFPIEVVVLQEGETVRVAVLDEMYRMKVYFEDAGNWAFMKNMTMPGQIEDEIVEASLSALGK